MMPDTILSDDERNALIDKSPRTSYKSNISFRSGRRRRDEPRDSYKLTRTSTKGPPWKDKNGFPNRNGNLYRALSFQENAEEITLSWNNINVYVPETTGRFCKTKTGNVTKHILKEVSGIVKPGTLLAIMGASGAGKSTLLNVLTYRNRGSLVVEGDVRINGQRIGEGMTSMSAYVQQDDLFVGTLKVREHLWFQAMLRMDSDISNNMRKHRIDEVIQELGLSKCADTFIGIPGRTKGISGGEMKRLSFASEVLTNPPLMYCDEPTSGLDSFMAQNVVQTLKNMAEKGKTIVCTIHQPSSEVYTMFDRLLLMAEGRVAYLGPASECPKFFEDNGYVCPMNFNPADYFVHTLAIVPGQEKMCRESVEKICNNYETSEKFKSVLDDIENTKNQASGEQFFEMDLDEEAFSDRSRYKANIFRQFYAVFWRSWLGNYRDTYVFNTRIIQTIAIGIFAAVIYFAPLLTEFDENDVNNINGAMFFTFTQISFMLLFGVVSVFPSEMPLYFRDHQNGMYRPIVYFLCKSFAEVPMFIFVPAVFVTIVYWMVGMYPDPGKFFICVGTIILVANTAVSFGYLISTCSSTVTLALSLAPPLTIPLMLFGGFFLNTGSIPEWIGWLKYLSWFQYANEILVINQWSGVQNITCTYDKANDTSLEAACYGSGDDVIASLSFKEENFGLDFLYLICLLVGYRFIAFMALFIRTKTHK